MVFSKYRILSSFQDVYSLIVQVDILTLSK